MPTCGLIGTITSDTIEYDDGRSFRNIGGVLYQAAALCGGGTATALFSNCGEDLRPQVETIVEDWFGLDRRGLTFLPGPGNRVRLRYSELVREREEFLESVVPALDPAPVLDALPDMNFLCLVFNSGFDIALSDWRLIADRAACPIWIDIHSLALAARVGAHRDYRALPDWPSWVRGASYLQANRQEVACMMGHPERWADEGEMWAMAARSFEIGLQAVFITLGKDGVLVATPEGIRRVPAPAAAAVVDTTGCGDVFAAATARALWAGIPPFRAAELGVALATQAVGISGLQATYDLAFRARTEDSG
jgi:hypothetical protein